MTSPRQSALASRHQALGSELSDWNGMGVPWEYGRNINEEYEAVRTAAGLFDVSGLKKIHVCGPDARSVLDHVCTRDLTKVYPGRSVYALILTDEAGITDDCIMFHIGPNDWLMVHAAGHGMEQLQKSAKGKDVSIYFDDDLHDISLQGPKALKFLDQFTPLALAELKYFHHAPTTLFDIDCLISRTGYSGERGYEIFAKADVIGELWDNILDKGNSMGIIPCSFNCIDMIRVEAALLFYPYDMTEENTPWEMGLGFTVSKNKVADFRGKEALQAARGKEKIKTFGLIADCQTAVDADADIFVDGKKVGRVTAPMYSPLLKKSFAMVQLQPSLARPGIKVEVRGPTIKCSAVTHALPVVDPDKKKRTQ